MGELISVEEAKAAVLRAVQLQPVQHVRLGEALGYTLAEPVVSEVSVPPFDNSGMDGYAVRTADLATVPAVLRVTDEVAAGSWPRRAVGTGTCARIMTGAPVPPGADAVVPVEWTTEAGTGEVQIHRAPAPGQHVRTAGRDVRVGDVVLDAGLAVTPPVVGMSATVGQDTVAVRVPPTVAVVATGDELVEAGERLGPGQIRNSNGPALAAQVKSAGGTPLPPLLARDDPSDIRRVLEQALGADVLVISGGVSVGDYDHVKGVLDEMGMSLLFWRVRQRPGKPLAFGTLAGRPLFGLPGNPVSSTVCFEQYVRPVLAAMLGRAEVVRPRHAAVLAAPTPKKAGLYHFVRGRAWYDREGRLHVRDTGPQGSNLYSSVVQANCLIHLPEDAEDPPAGTQVEIEWLTW